MISGLSFWNLEELSEEAMKTGKAEEYLWGQTPLFGCCWTWVLEVEGESRTSKEHPKS